MTIKVDPFLHPIPSELSKNKETRAFFEYFVRWAHDIWLRTGGGDDEIANTSTRESFPWDISESDSGDYGANLSSLYGQDQETEQAFAYPTDHAVKAYRAVTPTADYTALDHDFINATDNITILFPRHPSENAVFIVRNGDGSTIRLDGNGRMMNSELTGTIVSKGTSIEFYYFIDSNEWFAR